MSTLVPVYQKLSDVSDDEIELEVGIPNETLPMAPKESCCGSSCAETKASSNDSKCRKSFSRCCRGIFCLCFFGLFLFTIGSLAAIGFIGAQTHRCLHPAHRNTVVYTFDGPMKDVKALEIALVSGFVKVHPSKHVDQVEIHLTKAAHSEDLLQYMVHTSSYVDGKFTLRVDTPAFDWDHCQIATVEIFVPEVSSTELDISASVVLGDINLSFKDDYALNNVALHADVGRIAARGFHARNSFVATAGLALFNFKHIQSPQVSATVDVGYIRARHVETLQGKVEVNIGGARLHHWAAMEFVLNSKIGYVHMGEFYHSKVVTANVDYGQLRFVPETWQGQFKLESIYGFLSFDHHSSIPEPTYTDKNLATLAGYLTMEATDALNTPTKFEDSLTLTSKYGFVSVFVPAIPSDHFYAKHSHYKYPGK